uniref:Uncharacterized protein n=1 Tax=Anguilla anguilla TaxID=7936 RepID=A0A0E9QLW5_ANGAN
MFSSGLFGCEWTLNFNHFGIWSQFVIVFVRFSRMLKEMNLVHLKFKVYLNSLYQPVEAKLFVHCMVNVHIACTHFKIIYTSYH